MKKQAEDQFKSFEGWESAGALREGHAMRNTGALTARFLLLNGNETKIGKNRLLQLLDKDVGLSSSDRQLLQTAYRSCPKVL